MAWRGAWLTESTAARLRTRRDEVGSKAPLLMMGSAAPAVCKKEG